MDTPSHQIPTLELALIRRGLEDSAAARDICVRCHRTPLIGERVYPLPSGVVVCELCRKRRRETLSESRLVHNPAFGHTIRIVDQRGGREAWPDEGGADQAA